MTSALFSNIAYLLESPLNLYQDEWNSEVHEDHFYLETLRKTVVFVSGIVLYPFFGFLSLLGKGVKCLTGENNYSLDHAATTHESFPPKFQLDNKQQTPSFKLYEEKAKALMESKAPAPDFVFPELSEEIISVISNADDFKFHDECHLPKGIKRLRSGDHVCFFYDKTPNIVYKVSVLDSKGCIGPGTGYSSQDAKAYVDQATRARLLCQKDNLFLLHVPRSQIMELANGTYAIVQEKVDINGNFRYQQGLYRSFIASNDSQEYITELFRQLSIFVAKFNFSDVKYDNFPITKNGYVALFDLDEKGAIEGFLCGMASKRADGILSDLPAEMQHEMIRAAQPFLSEKDYQKIMSVLPKKKELSEKRWKKVKDYFQYTQSHGIITANQSVVLDPSKLSGLNESQIALAQRMVKLINEPLQKKSDWPNLRAARFAQLDFCSLTREESSFFHVIKTAFSFSRSSSELERYQFVDDNLEDVCEQLKGIGAIQSYRINHRTWVKVYS